MLPSGSGERHAGRKIATFALRDAVKDLRLATELYSRTGAKTPLANATKELYEQAARSAGDLDMSAIASLYEKQPVARETKR